MSDAAYFPNIYYFDEFITHFVKKYETQHLDKAKDKNLRNPTHKFSRTIELIEPQIILLYFRTSNYFVNTFYVKIHEKS